MNIFKIINGIKKTLNPERFDWDREMAKIEHKNRVERAMYYYDTTYDIMFEYCKVYGGREEGTPVSYLPHTTNYKSIIKRLSTLERRIKIEKLTDNIKKNVRKNK